MIYAESICRSRGLLSVLSLAILQVPMVGRAQDQISFPFIINEATPEQKEAMTGYIERQL